MNFHKLMRKNENMKATKQNRFLYNKSLSPLAGTLRKNMTKAEACLWKYVLRAGLPAEGTQAGMMKGYTFNRQRPVLAYITDFLCKRLRLVIEVDGATHRHEETYLKDKIKEKELEKAGFKVVRFLDEEVLRDIENVRRAIEYCVEEREKELGITSPLPPSQRGTKGEESFRVSIPPKGVSLSSYINSKPI